MRHQKLDLRAATALAIGLGLLGSCGETRTPSTDEDDGAMSSGISASGDDGTPSDDAADDDGDDGGSMGTEKLDAASADTGGVPNCITDAGCDQIDLLFVIDNSGTMGEEQLNLAANFPLLVERLQNLTDSEGNAVNPNVNIMVTTTDFGHPLCTTFQKPDYTPRRGAPVYEGCNTRINRFTGLAPEGEEPLVIEEACTANCPVDIAPGDPFIHFDVADSNVPNDDVAAALSCIGPQGIDGCGYEAPLETMLQALNDGSCWNNPDQEHCQTDPEWMGVDEGFLREDAVLAIAIVTDEVDCSVAAPDGYSYFTNPMETTYWNVNPELEIPQATSAICWNAGVTCEDGNADGVYESCTSSDSPALHSVERYKSYLNYLVEERGKEVVMLGILGVPPVTAHNENPPYEPTAGGVVDLVYRDWIDGQYPAGDILPDEWAAGVTADTKRFEFGTVGPGCTGQDDLGGFTGQAIPPVRVREVCESLNRTDEDGNTVTRCCIESICDDDFSPAINCLTGIIQESLQPAG
jgi:hypothetical protein